MRMPSKSTATKYRVRTGCTFTLLHIGVRNVFPFTLTLVVVVVVVNMGDHLDLRSFYPAFNVSSVDERPPATDFFSHGGDDHDILNAHLTRLLGASRPFPLAQCGQCRENPVIYVVRAREE